jgi:Cdc6-like AAA superfamily ATPase
MMLSDTQKRQLRHKVGTLFSPSAPVAVESLFAGRTKQLRTLLDAIPLRGRHAIVYGERGVGKTSLARVLTAFMTIDADGDVATPYASCDSTDTFDSVWRKVFADLPVMWEDPEASPPVAQEGTAADTLPTDTHLTPEWVRRYLEHYGQDRTLVVVIDEFDCFPDKSERRLFAETIKLLSDRSVPATVLLVGVSDDVSSLLAEHASIERALVQVQMPRMSRNELQEIIDKALAGVSMKMEPLAADRITFLSQGLPHYTHLLGLETAKQAIDAGTMTISLDHVRLAVHTAIENAQATIRESYHRATRSAHKDHLYGTVLLACAVAQGDEQGYFTAADVRGPMCQITKHAYEIPSFSRHLHDFCEENRGMVLRRIGAKHNYRFRFANPLLQPYVILKGIADGKISEETIKTPPS